MASKNAPFKNQLVLLEILRDTGEWIHATEAMKATIILVVIEWLAIVHAARDSRSSKSKPLSASGKPALKNPEYEKLIYNSEKFFTESPLPEAAKAFNNRLLNFPGEAEKLAEFAKSTRIVIHSRLYDLLRQSELTFKPQDEPFSKKLQKFPDEYKSFTDIWKASKPLRQKLRERVDQSRSLYDLWKGPPQLRDSEEKKRLDRSLHHLFKYRPLTFIGPREEPRFRGSKTFDLEWKVPLESWYRGEYKGETLLKYSEMEISALLGMSGPTLFLSDCNKDNPREDGKIEEGVIIGIVGARFEGRNKMESRYILFPFPKEHGPVDKLIAKLFDFENLLNNKEEQKHMVRELNEQKDPDFVNGISTEKVKGFVFRQVKPKHFAEPVYFNETIYRRRMRLIAEMVLGEANDRAASKQKKAYVVAVSIDEEDVWKVFDGQERLYLEELIDALEKSDFENISDLDLRYFKKECKNGKVLKNEGEIAKVKNAAKKKISIHCSNVSPAKLKQKMKDKLVVLTYPGNSNSFPGNEYWIGVFDGRGPAAARCSLITELHNPYVNYFLSPENPESVHVVEYKGSSLEEK